MPVASPLSVSSSSPFERGPDSLQSFLRTVDRLLEPPLRKQTAAGWQNLPESSTGLNSQRDVSLWGKGEGWGILGVFLTVPRPQSATEPKAAKALQRLLWFLLEHNPRDPIHG